VANYGNGSVTVLSTSPQDGTLGSTSKFFLQHKGRSLRTDRQEGPHAHQALFDSTNKHLIVTDLGLDKIFLYNFDQTNGRLSKERNISTAPGSGPRHVIQHPSGRWLYVVNELASTVTVYSTDVSNWNEEEDDEPPAGKKRRMKRERGREEISSSSYICFSFTFPRGSNNWYSSC
jgi:6-phosphogluconolactonase